MKGIIIYKGKYGATEQYAKWLGQDLDLPVSTAADIKNEKLNAYDYFIIGSSVYMGKLQIRKWLFKNENFIKGKRLFFFQVAASPVEHVGKRNQYNETSVPGSLKEKNQFFFLPGRMIMEKLNWIDKVLLKMGARLVKDPDEKKKMVTDFDNVLQENLHKIESAAREYAKSKLPVNVL